MSARLLRGQLRSMTERGFDVTLVAAPDASLEEVARRERVRVEPLKMARTIRPARDLLSLVALCRLLWRLRPHVVNAVTPKAGLLETAHRGTVFLDEIGDLDLQVQPKLLKVIEDSEFRRLGENRTRRVDIQLIAATHRDLREMADAKEFRNDLFFLRCRLTLR